MSQILCKDISMSYEKKLVVNKVSFEVKQGDYLCIVGENGSGKSTLMKGLLGLMPLKSGTISYGEGVSSKQIGYLPQQTLVQRDFPASVMEVVLSGCLNQRGFKPFYSAAEKKKALENMKILGIENLKNRSYKDLSGGQQQRTLLGRALCATNKILILDEPVSGLDPIVTAELYNIIDNLNMNHGVTIIMVSHDVEAAIAHSNKILHMDRCAEFFGPKEKYLKSYAGARFLGKSEGLENCKIGGDLD